MSRKVKIGLIQVTATYDESVTVEDKQNKLLALTEEALKNGADIVALPEAYQYTTKREVIKDESLLNSYSMPYKEKMIALARKFKAYVVPWDYYYEDGKVYNSSYIIDREGNVIGRYKKCNLTYNEIMLGITHGSEYPVFDLDFGKVGIMICFDNYFPETASALGSKGAEIVLYPLYGDTLKPQWETKIKARAIDYSMFVVPCQIDNKYDIAYTGVVNRKGETVAKLEQSDIAKVVEVNLDERVITCTRGGDNGPEDLRKYLHRCRNYKTYKCIAEEGYTPATWDEVYLKDE